MSATENMPPRADLPIPSDVRFGMRGLLFTMTCVAVATAVLGSSARKLDPEFRILVFWIWGICGLIVLGRVIYCAWLRIKLERMAGRTICVLAPRGFFGWARQPWMSVLIGLLWMAGGLYYLVMATLMVEAGASRRTSVYGPGIIPSIVSGALISIGIAAVWWNRTVQLRENGVLRGLRLLRWTHITKWDWVNDVLLLEGVDQRHRDMRIGAVANAETLGVAKHLVNQRASNRSWSGLPQMLREDAKKEASPLVPIQSGRIVTIHGMMSAFGAYVLFCIAFAIFLPLGRPSRDFTQGAIVGTAIAIASMAYGARRVAEAGGPIVRLKRRFDWPSVLVAAGMAAGGYFANQRLIFPNSYVGLLLGIATGLGLSVLAGMIAREHFDLCANGVVLIRWTFLPWKNVQLLKWNRDGNGRLLLRSGWRRVAAKVPNEHRDFVDRVLHEKLRFDSQPTPTSRGTVIGGTC